MKKAFSFIKTGCCLERKKHLKLNINVAKGEMSGPGEYRRRMMNAKKILENITGHMV